MAFSGLHTQHPWLTVTGGAKRYVEKIIAPLRDRIYLKRGAVAVRRAADGVRVTDDSGHTERYDHVILACHADQALHMLHDADDHERATLGQFKYQPNTALVHTDAKRDAATALCWSSWNYRVSHDAQDGWNHRPSTGSIACRESTPDRTTSCRSTAKTR